jgi:hypothetical protein
MSMQHRDHHARGLASRRLLLAFLADAECERLGQVSTVAQTQETLRWYRARFDLLRRRDLEAFLDSARLGEAELWGHMRTLSNIAQAQRRHKQLVEHLSPRYQAIFSVRDWLIEREPAADGNDAHDHS